MVGLVNRKRGDDMTVKAIRNVIVTLVTHSSLVVIMRYAIVYLP
jgi:hypothetical protein